MPKSPFTINGKKLADRWNIDTIDVLYIMLNHGLNVVDQDDDEVSIGDVFEDFKKNKDASEYMFSLSEVNNTEAKLEVDGEIPHADTMKGKELLTRWDMHDAQIYSIMLNTGLAAIDPFGHELDSNRIFYLLKHNTLEVSDLLFRLSDIKELETKYDELKPMLQVQDEGSVTDKIETLPDSEQETIPVFCFYKNGDMWNIGKKGKIENGGTMARKLSRRQAMTAGAAASGRGAGTRSTRGSRSTTISSGRTSTGRTG